MQQQAPLTQALPKRCLKRCLKGCVKTVAR
ncbi:MAG: hypothetical protein QOF46_3812, partial [Paraburkholderia sp.]|nr:hypothetical protein [Paraburkholderia sp.]